MARSKDITYIYHLPHTERKMLSRILDRNDKWEELGEKYMKYDFLTIQVYVFLFFCFNLMLENCRKFEG